MFNWNWNSICYYWQCSTYLVLQWIRLGSHICCWCRLNYESTHLFYRATVHARNMGTTYQSHTISQTQKCASFSDARGGALKMNDTPALFKINVNIVKDFNYTWGCRFPTYAWWRNIVCNSHAFLHPHICEPSRTVWKNIYSLNIQSLGRNYISPGQHFFFFF